MPAVPTSDLYMMRGAQFDTEIELGISLTGMTLSCYMATSYYSSNKIPVDIEVLDESTGRLRLHLPKEITSGLKSYKRYVFTLVIHSLGDIPYPVLQGVVIVDPSTI